MTLEAWIRPTSLSSWDSVLTKENGSDLAYALYANQDVPRPGVFVRVGSDRSTAGTATLPLNTWSHLAATYDGTALRLYVNGDQVSSAPLTGSIAVSSGPLRIGGNAIWGEFFHGLIDEVRVYNQALAPSEIQADMNTPITDNTLPTVGTTTPASGATGVLVTANVTAQFSEAIDPTTVTTSAFELRNPANGLVAATVTYDSATRTATLDATADLAQATTYTALLKGAGRRQGPGWQPPGLGLHVVLHHNRLHTSDGHHQFACGQRDRCLHGLGDRCDLQRSARVGNRGHDTDGTRGSCRGARLQQRDEHGHVHTCGTARAPNHLHRQSSGAKDLAGNLWPRTSRGPSPQSTPSLRRSPPVRLRPTRPSLRRPR